MNSSRNHRKSIYVNSEDEEKLKTICEFILLDQYNDFTHFDRFEKCFQPLLNDKNLNLTSIYKEICGGKRKYINFSRLSKAYAKYINNSSELSNETKKFFRILLNDIYKKDGSFIGETQEKCHNYSTLKSHKGRKCLTKIQVFNDSQNNIHGIQLFYDDVLKDKMFPTKIENDLILCLDLKLALFEQELRRETETNEFISSNKINYRDGITHIFGTLNSKTKIINFLGFKCASGKTLFVGFPDGKGFLFGKFGYRLHDINIQINEKGINKIVPFFNFPNPRRNFFIHQQKAKAAIKEEDIPIYEEEKIASIKDEKEIDQLISVPIIDHSIFIDPKMLDNTKGNDYKEVVNQVDRKWMMNRSKTIQPKSNKIYNSIDINKLYDKEYQERSNLLNNFSIIKNDDNDNKFKILHLFKKVKNLNEIFRSTKINIKSESNKSNKKWNGDIPTASYLNFLHNIRNYKLLKTKFGNLIHNKIRELTNDRAQITMLSQTIPDMNRKDRIINQGENRNKKYRRVNIVNKMIKIWEKLKSNKENKENKEVKNSDDDKNKKVYFLDENKYTTYNSFDKNDEYENNEDEESKNDDIYIEKYKKLKIAQENWKFFVDGVCSMKTVYIIQTIGTIIKAIHAYNNDNIPIKEKLRLYHLLEKNEKIVEFLSNEQKNNSQKSQIAEKGLGNNKEKNPNNLKETIEEDEYKYNDYQNEDFLLPDKYPEKITSLEELDLNMKNLSKILNNRSINLETKEKAKKLQDLYFIQRNIIIENKTKDAKDEIISKLDIDINEIYKKENQKREEAKEIQRLENMKEKLQEKDDLQDNVHIVSITSLKQPNKIFHGQKMYRGKEPFVDPLFKPEKSSLCPFNDEGWILPGQTWESEIGRAHV